MSNDVYIMTYLGVVAVMIIVAMLVDKYQNK